MITIVLHKNDIAHAANVAVHRQSTAIGERYGATGRSHYSNLVGCCGEVAVAKHFDKFWNGIANPGDVGGLQVRATDRKTGRLIIHPPDENDRCFICAVVERPRVHLVGWLWGVEAKQRQWWQPRGPGGNGRPCFMVPQKFLRPMEKRMPLIDMKLPAETDEELLSLETYLRFRLDNRGEGDMKLSQTLVREFLRLTETARKARPMATPPSAYKSPHLSADTDRDAVTQAKLAAQRRIQRGGESTGRQGLPQQDSDYPGPNFGTQYD